MHVSTVAYFLVKEATVRHEAARHYRYLHCIDIAARQRLLLVVPKTDLYRVSLTSSV